MMSGLTPFGGMYKPLLYAIAMSRNAKTVEILIRMDKRDSGESKIVNHLATFVLKYIREILTFFRNKTKN